MQNAVPAWGSYLYQNFLLPALSPNLTNEWLNLNSPFSATVPAPDYFGHQWQPQPNQNIHLQQQQQPQQQQQQHPIQPPLSNQSSFDSVTLDIQSGPSNYYSQPYYNDSYIAPSLLGPQNPSTTSFGTPGSQQISPSADVIDNQIVEIKRSPSPFDSGLNSPHPSPKRKASGKVRSLSMDSDLDLSHDDHEEVEGVERDGMIWGMKVEDYRALSARERKRVRNRISARTFRAKRKGTSPPTFDDQDFH